MAIIKALIGVAAGVIGSKAIVAAGKKLRKDKRKDPKYNPKLKKKKPARKKAAAKKAPPKRNNRP